MMAMMTMRIPSPFNLDVRGRRIIKRCIATHRHTLARNFFYCKANYIWFQCESLSHPSVFYQHDFWYEWYVYGEQVSFSGLFKQFLLSKSPLWSSAWPLLLLLLLQDKNRLLKLPYRPLLLRPCKSLNVSLPMDRENVCVCTDIKGNKIGRDFCWRIETVQMYGVKISLSI